MSLDTKYRPISYSDVLGQDATKKILRRFVSTGTGFRQSYLFAGPYGSGKTTLGRILGRALQCDSPQEGDPCNQCPSCVSILTTGSSDCFTEMDAATNSGKAEIKKLIEDIAYGSFSGKKRIYLLDEAHQLSTDALDALLKPLEENVPGTNDKKLVCIFCTTEPEKMRATVLSRCAPAFLIEPVPPSLIANRLSLLCDKEGLEYDLPQLHLIAEIAECHIRDAIKAVEGVSMLGPINEENVRSYLHLDTNDALLDLLLGGDLSLAFQQVDFLMERISPATAYTKLADICLSAFQHSLGVSKPHSYWNKDKIQSLSQRGANLLAFANKFASRPARPSVSMLKCDLASLFQGIPVAQPLQPVVPIAVSTFPEKIKMETDKLPLTEGKLPVTGLQGGVYVDARAVSKKTITTETIQSKPTAFDSHLFATLLVLRLKELGGKDTGGHTRRPDMDSN